MLKAQFKIVFGGLDLLAAAMLWRKQTRRIGLMLAVVGFSGGLYGQIYGGGDLTQVMGLLVVSILGLLMSPSPRE